MTLIQTLHRNRMALHASKQATRSAEAKTKPKLLRCKNIVNIETFKFKTLNTKKKQLPELTASAVEQNIDVISVEEHRYYESELELKYHDTGNVWKLVSASARKSFVNTTM